MVITRIKAGLGNQMFQYACGRALALRNNDILKLDINNWLKKKEVAREYLLSNFNIIENIANDSEIMKLRFPYGIMSMIYYKIRVKLGMTNTAFYPKILSKKGNLYLDGYWQSEKYFDDYAEIIRKDFSQKQDLRETSKSILKDIEKNEMPVSLQIRRGDNVHNPTSIRFFGKPTDEYYEQAVKIILDKARNENKSVYLYVFSDEIEWARKNLHFDCEMIFVSCPEIIEWEELSLMKACKHHIISNSTFGWWGAWLDPNSDKIVIAPKRWSLMKEHQFKDLIPNVWLRL
jgi:hypothetical protein